MSLLNQVFQGNPSTLGAVAAGGSQVAPNIAVDTVNAALYLSTGNGWQPFSDALAKTVFSNTSVAAIANVLTLVAPATGIYRVTTYAVQTTATASDLPSTNVSYTEGETGVAQPTNAIQAEAAETAAGAHVTGTVTINALAGSSIVVSSAAGTGVYTLKARVEFLG
jgi:hypothetical protein